MGVKYGYEGDTTPPKKYINMYYAQLQEIDALIVVASTNGYQRLLQKNLKDKETITNIIKKLEDKRDEQET